MTTSSFLSLHRSPNAQKVRERAGTKFSSAKSFFVFIYDVVLGKGNFNVLKWKLWLKGHSVWAERTGQLSIFALLYINIYMMLGEQMELTRWTDGVTAMVLEEKCIEHHPQHLILVSSNERKQYLSSRLIYPWKTLWGREQCLSGTSPLLFGLEAISHFSE